MDWKKKLTSRKFWLAVIGFVTALLIAFNVGENQVAQIASIISAFGTVIAYVFAESYADGNANKGGDDDAE